MKKLNYFFYHIIFVILLKINLIFNVKFMLSNDSSLYISKVIYLLTLRNNIILGVLNNI